MPGVLMRSATTGHLLRGPNGHLVRSCRRGPCRQCANPSNTPSVSVGGTCEDEWYTTWAGGVYAFDSLTLGEGFCDWVFTLDVEMEEGGEPFTEHFCLSIMYFGDTEANGELADTWWAALYRCAFKEWCIYGYAQQAGVACGEDGNLAGSLSIPGNPGTDAEGCTVSVTL